MRKCSFRMSTEIVSYFLSNTLTTFVELSSVEMAYSVIHNIIYCSSITV